MKKFLAPISITVVLALVVVLYYVFFHAANTYDAIPDSAVAVVEINDWSKFDHLLSTTENAALRKTAAVIKLEEQIGFMQKLFAFNTPLATGLASGKITISTHLTSAGDFDYLFTIPVKGIEADEILHLLNTKHDVASVIKRTYKERAVVDVTMKDGRRFSFTIIKNVLALSFTSFLTENAITAITTGYNLSSDKGFKRLIKKFKSEGPISLFINYKNADVIFPVSLKPQKMALLSDIKENQNWVGYNISFEADKINFSGVGLLNTSALQTSKNILSNTIWNNIPDDAAYVNVGLNDLKDEGNVKSSDNKLLKADFKNWIGDAHAFVTLEPLREDFTEYNIFIVQVTDENKAIENLKHLVSLDGTKAVPVDTCMHAAIFHLKDGSVINQVFGSSFTAFTNSFFVVNNHLAIFCNSPDILKFTMERINLGETLNKSDALRKSIGRLKTATGLVYINPAKASAIFSGLIKEGSTLQPWLSNLNAISFISDVNGEWNTMHAGIITGSQNISVGGGLLWKTKLQTVSDFAPQIVLNISTGDKEIFTQDTANNIYLISNSGDVLFTRNIGEKIVSSVYQIDYYNNGKLQYIFNSANHIFLIDGLGNDAGSYPLRLSYPAATGLTVVNNSGSKCRYYVPCTNGSIYGYEVTGRPLSGWSPLKGVGVISKPLQSFKFKKSELMLAFNNSGKLILLGNKGDIKWSIDNLPLTNQNFSIVRTGDDFQVMNAAGNQLIQISSDGNDNIKPLIDSAFSFAATPTSDSGYSYFYSGQHDVRAYNEKGSFTNGISLKSSVIGGILVATIPVGNEINASALALSSQDHYLLVKDESLKKMMIYDLALKPIAEYPVNNTATFAICDLFDHKELIGIQPDVTGTISCYRIR